MPKGPFGAIRLRAEELDPDRVRRFWSKVRKTSGCWYWTGGTNPGGYGQFSVEQIAKRRARLALAHRVSYALAHGEAPAGTVIRHTCDHPACVRPKHLVCGSQAENMQDHMRRGTGRTLSWKDIQAIRASSRPPRELVARYRVSRRQITQILHNRTWTDPDYVPTVNHSKGNTHHCARLTSADVLEARTAHAAGESVRAISSRYGVAYSTMWEAVNGETWKAA